ncbi:ABC transporter ATP-binding protein [Metabacillus idriensis]|uniref:ATP-binding cassette domain-containing protein n=1 Tax=Metabacillus idriensis TaxID=324768 RepID=A0A6I2MF29_9BACI|nr:ABC transporter ATP-binding protein [Metabacillus idriensis]MCM3597904.1 ABC transporter ATP-binding protein [Metabacillus idriensis]MRX56389.1 ATP-binding cassette domain-containing protein [Metabacillus idriensis]OHR70646.1 ABC transporter [Bacillus sp. HMSC76G11]
MLSLSRISKSYTEDQHVLLPTDLNVKKGEFVSIIGPSGCGKSTLLDIIAGINKPTNGTVHYNGEEITNRTGLVGYMPQSDVLFPWRTVLDNVILPLEIQGSGKEEARNQARGLFPKFGLEGYEDHYPFMLSGGMRQRANFLRAYLNNKELLLLDEPFGKLDAMTRLELQKWFIQICEETGQTVIFITHDMDEAIFLSDRIFILSPRPGRIIEEVSVEFTRPRTDDLFTNMKFASLKRRLLDVLYLKKT